MTKKDILNITKNLKVLYVEDDESIKQTSVELFQNFFSDIKVAGDGVEALELYNSYKFDLIITDISMPKMDGIELIKLIRQKNLSIPIIVYSALNNPTSITACVTLNVDAYLLKPMVSKNFIEALEKVTLKIMSNDDASTLEIISKIEEKFKIDKLTGLKSHSLLMDKIDNMNSHNIPAMMLINIDEFHIYNEIYGLHVGDILLHHFAKNLENFIDGTEYELYRMSGDEFVILEITKMLDPDKYIKDIEALIAYIDTNPIVLPNIKEPINLAITIGVSFDENNSYGKADMALQEARRRGRQYLGYNSEADRREELQQNLYWREEINSAVEEQRIHAHYQPIVDTTGKIIKYESLIRMLQIQSDGSEKLIAPASFLDFSKISRQYVNLTKIMINESFKTMLDLNIHISINLTFHDIVNREINKLLRDRIKKHHLETKTNFDISSQVIFELLEHPSHKDYDIFVEFINEFKSMGVLITIDEFGLGFSDMAKVAELAPHYVKIDASLIKNINNDKHAYSLVKAIVKFTQELGIKTIAEHVSSKEIYERAKELDIDEFQGFYMGKPISKTDLEESLL